MRSINANNTYYQVYSDRNHHKKYSGKIIETPKVNKTVQLMSPMVTEKIKYRIDFLMCPIK